MAMKKKFLGLAMAAMVALPATSVYATGTTDTTGTTSATQETQKIESEAATKDVPVEVTGTVTNKKGEAPQKIEVELPSKMAFIVDANGDVAETTYKISNKSQNVDLALSVGAFTGGLTSTDGTGNGIQLVPKTKMEDDRTELFRNQVSLVLSNTDANGKKEVDLGNYRSLAADAKKLGQIGAGQNTLLKLTGKGGQKTITSEDKSDVDSKGAEQKFDLVFSITKVAP